MTQEQKSMKENLPDSYLKKFCDKHLNVRDCGFAHPFVTNDGKCGFCELISLRKISSTERQRSEELEKEVERLKKQLPDGMQDCTIRFMKCEVGHGTLTADNWIKHDCRYCKIESLQKRIEDLEQEINGKGGHKFLADGLRKRIADLEAELDLFQNPGIPDEELDAIATRYVSWGAEALARQKVKYQWAAGRHAKKVADLSTLCDELAGALATVKDCSESHSTTEDWDKAFKKVCEALSKHAKFNGEK